MKTIAIKFYYMPPVFKRYQELILVDVWIYIKCS